MNSAMIKTIRKTLINLGTRWRLSEEALDNKAAVTNQRQAEIFEQKERQILDAYDALQNSLLSSCFKFYVEKDLTVPTVFVIGKYIGFEGQKSVPEMSMTAHASTLKGYDGMLIKTVRPGKVEFLQYNAKSVSEISQKIMNYITLLS